MRIALVSPYSWTYPGGVTRHIEALSSEFAAAGNDVRILSSFDPPDRLAARLHRGAQPQPRELPENLIALGRTVGLPANGAVSNLALSPSSVRALRRELRAGGYDVIHIHEPVVPLVCWDAMCATEGIPLVGTFHTFSENALTNGAAALLGARRRMNHLRARIAVSEAAAWTAERFYGGRYRIIPNGVHLRPLAATGELDPTADVEAHGHLADPLVGHGGAPAAPLRILFIGQAVERKGLGVLLRAFEALRDHVPATLTLVGASAQEIAPLLLDDRGIRALGKVSEQEKLTRLAEADVLCAPSLGGESFGMVLTEGFAAGVPVVSSDIPGYRDVVRDGVDGLLVAPGDALGLAEALRQLALEPSRRAELARAAAERAERFSWSRVAGEVMGCYEDAIAVGEPQGRLRRVAVRHGLAPADLMEPVRARRLPSLQPAPTPPAGKRALVMARRFALMGISFAGLVLALLALARIGVDRVAASLLASSPGLVAAGLGLMCLSMFARAIAWHAILSAAPTWRKAKRRDALQGTCIGVLMSATLPARLGEPSRALIVARRLGRARETLPVVLGTMVSQTLLNLLALAVLGVVMFSSVDLFNGHHGALVAAAVAPLGMLMIVLLAPALLPRARDRSMIGQRSARLRALLLSLRGSLVRVREGLNVFSHPRPAAVATATQLGAWGLQLIACWLLLMALGLAGRVGLGGAAAVLFAVNVTAVVPATPSNVGVFQAACIAVLAGAYHVSTPDALAYGIVLQAVEVVTALVMGMPALVKEGLSWKDVRLRTMHAAPVKLPALPERPELGQRRGVAASKGMSR